LSFDQHSSIGELRCQIVSSPLRLSATRSKPTRPTRRRPFPYVRQRRHLLRLHPGRKTTDIYSTHQASKHRRKPVWPCSTPSRTGTTPPAETAGVLNWRLARSDRSSLAVRRWWRPTLG